MATDTGTVLRRALNARGWVPDHLAARTGFHVAIWERVLAGELAITEPMARALAGVFGGTPGRWLRLQTTAETTP